MTAVLVTIIITLTATVIFASIVAYFCVKKKLNKKTLNLSNQLPQEKVLYEQISLPT